MKHFGISSMFAFRPHVSHLAYLAHLLREAGHRATGFDCPAEAPSCYPRNLKGNPKVRECPKCLVGGIRTFGIPVTGTVRRTDRVRLPDDRAQELTVSSAATVFRTEDPAELESAEFRALQEDLRPSVEMVYGSALRWIEAERLDGMLLFNGRMDLTAALRAACEDAGIPFVTTERAWLGHGISIVPNGNVLDLWPYARMCREYMDKPLTAAQARYAGRLAAERYLRANTFEWRDYNPDEEPAEWPDSGVPSSGGVRVLVLPSSRNEFEGHPERRCPWPDYTWAMGEVLDRLGAGGSDVVIRCHPNWGQAIAGRPGHRPEEHYTAWGRGRGLVVIPSTDKRSTYDLIRQADVVLVNGSSTGVEAGLIGKRVVSVGRCTYEEAGFSIQIHEPGAFGRLRDLDDHDPERTARRALRYLFLHANRMPQYVPFVRARSTTDHRFLRGGDPERLLRILREGHLRPDDPDHGRDRGEEDRVVQACLARDWGTLIQHPAPEPEGDEIPIRRIHGFRWVDAVRARLPRGDQ